VWLPFLVAFIVALLTACSYLELVTKYPKAAGAALYTHKAFGVHFLTFLVAFAVMCSGLTSSASAAKAFAANFSKATGLGFSAGAPGLAAIAVCFLLLLALINLRGVGESVKTNVVLTCLELTGLLIIIVVGWWAISRGDGDLSRPMSFDVADSQSVFTAITAATALAFFALVGFEDSVNMAEEVRNPVRVFPRMLLLGMSIGALIYVLVGIAASALIPVEHLSEGSTPLLQVLSVGAPGFPIEIFAVITMAAVANGALLNMLMASRLLYGLAQEKVLPRALGKLLPNRATPWVAIVFTTALAIVLLWYADLSQLGSTTSFLLLCVFTVVNIAVLVLRRDAVDHEHFRTPTALPVLGAVTCAFLASPLSRRESSVYPVAGGLLLVGLVLWLLTWTTARAMRDRAAR
jgi:amino acid transporter